MSPFRGHTIRFTKHAEQYAWTARVELASGKTTVFGVCRKAHRGDASVYWTCTSYGGSITATAPQRIDAAEKVLGLMLDARLIGTMGS